tara:strand:- start:164 stop:541 length:378 start_codon:yes stop_codon:yes gene_type:complete
MRKSFLVIFVSFLLIGCSPSETDIRNACVEMSQTSVGFSGPTIRMEIMKSYGISSSYAATFNDFFAGYANLLNIAERSEFYAEEARCLRRIFSCDEILIAVVNDDPAPVTRFNNDLEDCMGFSVN